MGKRYYCTVQRDVTGNIILWGVGHTKKEAEAEAAEWTASYSKSTGEPDGPIYANLDTVPTDRKTYAVVAHPDFVDEDSSLHVIDGKLVLTDDPAGAEFGVAHAKSCAYAQSGYDFRVICTCKAKHMNKPFRHWQEMALEAVVDWIIHGAENMDYRSLPGTLAKRAFLTLANELSPEMIERTYQRKKQWEQGVCKALSYFTGEK
jgi:hypothetical protein